MSPNFVYQHPTIASLALYASAVGGSGPQSFESRTVRHLQDFLHRYTDNFPPHVPSIPAPGKEVILITGTTGSLGSAVLARLSGLDAVGTIYALNRPNAQRGLLERQQDALKSRGYDPEVVMSAKVELIQGELTADGLRLNNPQLEQEVQRLPFSCLLFDRFSIDPQFRDPYHPHRYVTLYDRMDSTDLIMHIQRGEWTSTYLYPHSRRTSAASAPSSTSPCPPHTQPRRAWSSRAP